MSMMLIYVLLTPQFLYRFDFLRLAVGRVTKGRDTETLRIEQIVLIQFLNNKI